jgi:hypothetical protein
MAAASSVKPCTTGTSLASTEVISSVPMPGSANTCSTRTAPVMTTPRIRPPAVMIGPSALRSAYRVMTRTGPTPRA